MTPDAIQLFEEAATLQMSIDRGHLPDWSAMVEELADGRVRAEMIQYLLYVNPVYVLQARGME